MRCTWLLEHSRQNSICLPLPLQNAWHCSFVVSNLSLLVWDLACWFSQTLGRCEIRMYCRLVSFWCPCLMFCWNAFRCFRLLLAQRHFSYHFCFPWHFMLWLLLELFMHPGIQKKLTLVLTDELMAEISDDSGLTLRAFFFSKHVSHGECFFLYQTSHME